MISGSTLASNASNTSNKKWLTCTFRGLKKFPPKKSWPRKMGLNMRKWRKWQEKRESKLMTWKTLLRSLKMSSFRTINRTQKRRLRKLRKLKTIAPARRSQLSKSRKRLRKKKGIIWTWTNFTRRISSSQTRRLKTSQPKKN